MSNFYKKYQNLIDDFVNKNSNYIIEYCRRNYINYTVDNINHNIDIKLFMGNISNDLKDNYDFILDSVKYNSYFIKYASNDLKNNYNIVLSAVQNDGNTLLYASNNLKNNYDIVLAAVEKDGVGLFYASYNLKNNYDIVLNAVKNNGLFLQYIIGDLRNNYDVVLAAVKNEGWALKYVPDNLKNNYTIALNAILNDYYYRTILYLPQKFIKNRKLIVNMNNSKHYEPYYNINKIIKIMDYKFKIKQNKLSNKKLNSIFIFF